MQHMIFNILFYAVFFFLIVDERVDKNERIFLKKRI